MLVGEEWFDVVPGSWYVDLRGPFLHAGWTSHGNARYSAFISHVRLVRHAS